MDKRITKIQFALFFKNDFNGDFVDFTKGLKDLIDEDDYKETQSIPLPSNAPSEIPRLNMNLEGFNISVAKNRLDLFFESNIEKTSTYIEAISNFLIGSSSIQINRVGFVKTFFIEGGFDDLKNNLNTKFKEEDFKEINIRISKQKSIYSYECNNIEHFSNGFFTGKGVTGKKDGIVLTRDINTLLETKNINENFKFSSRV